MLKFALCTIGIVLLGFVVVTLVVRAKVSRITTLVSVYEEAEPLESPELPAELEYLRPALAILAEIPAEELGDENEDAAAVLDKAVATRTAGMSKAEKRRILEADFRLMAQWLKHPDNRNSPGQFALGHYLGLLMYGE